MKCIDLSALAAFLDLSRGSNLQVRPMEWASLPKPRPNLQLDFENPRPGGIKGVPLTLPKNCLLLKLLRIIYQMCFTNAGFLVTEPEQVSTNFMVSCLVCRNSLAENLLHFYQVPNVPFRYARKLDHT